MAQIFPASRVFLRFFAWLAFFCGIAANAYAQAAPAAKPPPPTAFLPVPASPIPPPLAYAPTGPADKTGLPDAQLVYAASVGSGSEIALAAKGGANPNALNGAGIPALSLAATRTDAKAAEAMQALLNAGAKIDIADDAGQSPLFYAARNGNAATVKFLLEHGAKYYLQDKSGNIARTYAFREGHNDIVTQMDQFVTGQTAKVMGEYDARNKALAARAQTQAQTVVPQPAMTNASLMISSLPPTPAKKPPVDRLRLQQVVHDLSYNACGETYWKYVREKKIEGELNDEQITSTVDAHRLLRGAAERELLQSIGASRDYVNKIIAPSQAQLLEQFIPYPTNAHRRGAGIGEKADAKRRCESIAGSWEVSDEVK